MPKIDLPSQLCGPPWSVGELSKFGISYGRSLDPALARPFHGIRSQYEPTSWHERALAYWARPRPHQVLIGAHAASFWGLPVPQRLLRERGNILEIAVPSTRHRPKASGIRSRRLRSDLHDGMDMNGIRVASPQLALLSICQHLTLRERAACCDALVTASSHYPGLPADRPLMEMSRLQTYGAHVGAATGGRALREAIDLAREHVDSPYESFLRVGLIEANLPEPTVQFPVRDGCGITRAILDLAYEEARIDIEYEGDHHRVDELQWHRDIERERWLRSQGWEVIRVTKADLRDRLPALVAQIARLLEVRTSR